jgi:hypothetical protein
MDTQFWMITDRNIDAKGARLGSDHSDATEPLTFWVSDQDNVKDLQNLKRWRNSSREQFKKLLLGATKAFPVIKDPADQERQQHVTLFVHGFNNSWEDAVARYHQICRDMYSGADGLGVCVLFT